MSNTETSSPTPPEKPIEVPVETPAVEQPKVETPPIVETPKETPPVAEAPKAVEETPKVEVPAEPEVEIEYDTDEPGTVTLSDDDICELFQFIQDNIADLLEAEDIEEAKKWIQKAIKRPGGLHRALGIPEDQPIPLSRIRAAAKKKGRIGRMARLALTLRKLRRRKESVVPEVTAEKVEPVPPKVEEPKQEVKENKVEEPKEVTPMEDNKVVESKGVIEEPTPVRPSKNEIVTKILEKLRTRERMISSGKIPEDFYNEQGKVTEAYQNPYGSSAAATALPDIWAAEVAKLSETQAVLSNIVDWRDDITGKPGDKLIIPTIVPISFGAFTEGATLTPTAPTTDAATVKIGYRGAQIDIDRIVMEDAIPSLVQSINERLAEGYQYDIDSRLLTWLADPASLTAGTLTTANLSTVAMTASIIARAMGSMRSATYEPKWLIIHPQTEVKLMQSEQFTNAATYGDASIIRNGRVYTYLGLQIIVTPQVYSTGGTYKSFLVANGAVVGSTKRNFDVSTDFDVQVQRHLIVATGRWGATFLHPKGIFEIDTAD